MSPAVLGRLLVILGACGASSGLMACSWLLDWSAYTDGGQLMGEPNGVETGGGSSGGPFDSGQPDDVGIFWIDASVDASEASGDSAASGADGADASKPSDGAGAGDGTRDVDNEAPSCFRGTGNCNQFCPGCLDSMGFCHDGRYDNSCGNNGAQCQNCGATSNPFCSNGMCSTSPNNQPTCSLQNVSTCGHRCTPGLQSPCCTSNNQCGCTLFFPIDCQ